MLCVLCVCFARACCALCVLCARCVCVCCVVCVCVCAWQNNQHLKDGEMNCQTNCCHQTKKWISPMQAASPLACGPAAASPHIHTTSTCVHFAKQKPTCNTDTKTPKQRSPILHNCNCVMRLTHSQLLSEYNKSELPTTYENTE